MENKPKHTPGPWRIGDAGNTVFGPNDGKICPAIIAALGRQDKAGNARLIAAAPELLEALKKLEARVDWFLSEDFGRALGINYNPLSQEFFELEQARAAIAKAEGGHHA